MPLKFSRRSVIFGFLASLLPLTAQAKKSGDLPEEMVSIDLVERLWQGVLSWPGARTMILPDRLPQNLVNELPIPPQTQILGTAVRFSMTLIGFETALPAKQIRQFYDVQMAKLGWQKQQDVPPENVPKPSPSSEPDLDESKLKGNTGMTVLPISRSQTFLTRVGVENDNEGWVYRRSGTNYQIYLGVSAPLKDSQLGDSAQTVFGLTVVHYIDPIEEAKRSDWDQAQMKRWIEDEGWKDFYHSFYRPEGLELPDLTTMPQTQIAAQGGDSLTDAAWQSRLFLRTSLAWRELLNAYAEKLVATGWQQQRSEITPRLTHQIWQRSDAGGKRWELSFYLLESNHLPDEPDSGVLLGQPQFSRSPDRYVGEILIQSPDVPPVFRPQLPLNDQAPANISLRFAEFLLGDYIVGQLPAVATWLQPNLIPPNSKILISNAHLADTAAKAQGEGDQCTAVLDVPMSPSQVAKFYREVLTQQGWQLSSFDEWAQGNSGLPFISTPQICSRSHQQFVYSILPGRQPQQSDVRLVWGNLPTSVSRKETGIEWIDVAGSQVDGSPEALAQMAEFSQNDKPPEIPLPQLHLPETVKSFGVQMPTSVEGQFTQHAAVATTLDLKSMAQIFDDQMRSAGWRKLTIEQVKDIAVSRWQLTIEGQRWQTDLTVMTQPNAEYQLLLRCDRHI